MTLNGYKFDFHRYVSCQTSNAFARWRHCRALTLASAGLSCFIVRLRSMCMCVDSLSCCSAWMITVTQLSWSSTVSSRSIHKSTLASSQEVYSLYSQLLFLYFLCCLVSSVQPVHGLSVVAVSSRVRVRVNQSINKALVTELLQGYAVNKKQSDCKTSDVEVWIGSSEEVRFQTLTEQRQRLG